MLDEEALETQLGAARAALRQIRADAATAPPAEDITAEAADGRLKVTLGADGRVTGVDIHPVLLREGSTYLGEQLADAVNAALDARAEFSSSTEPVPDLDALNASIELVQDAGIRQMRQVTNSFAAALRRADR